MSVPDPNTKITYPMTTIYGGTVTVGRRTGAHLDYTRARLERLHPGCDFNVIQSAWNTGVEASAGTHDFDACLDVSIDGLDWWDAQGFLRASGWAAWYRYPPAFTYHLHMISLGYGTARVGIYIPGQVDDYRNHRTGLAGHYSDPSWHPADIDATVFDYPAWIKELDQMSAEDRRAIEQAIREDGRATRDLIQRRAMGERTRDRAQAAKLGLAFDALPEALTKRDVLKVFEKWQAEQDAAEDEPTP